MYATFTSFLVGTLITHEYFRNYYPEEYKTFLFFIGYNSIYAFSRLQIFYNKCYKTLEIHIIPFFQDYSQKITPYLHDLGLLEKTIRKDLKLIKNGITTKYYKKTELEFLKRLKPHFEGTYDIMIYTDYDNVSNNGKINKIIYNEIPENLEYKESTATFILSEIVINNTKDSIQSSYKINFSNDKYNYMIVGNKFCRNFIPYFLRKHYNHIYKEHLRQLIEHEYTLKIIDNNVNMIDICKMKILTINYADCNVEEFKEKEYKIYESEMFPDFNIKGIVNVLEESCMSKSNDDIKEIEGNINFNIDIDIDEDKKERTCSNDDSYVKL